MTYKTIVQKSLIGVAVLGLLVFLHIFALSSDAIRSAVSSFGFLGIFVVAVLSGFNLLVPIPAIGFAPLYQELGFSLFSIVIVTSIGMVVGDGIGFVLGIFGRGMVKDNKGGKILAYMTVLQKKHRLFPYTFLLLYGAFIPLPNELLVIPMAFVGYSFFPIAVALFFGNIVFNILGAFGIQSVVALFL